MTQLVLRARVKVGAGWLPVCINSLSESTTGSTTTLVGEGYSEARKPGLKVHITATLGAEAAVDRLTKMASDAGALCASPGSHKNLGASPLACSCCQG